MLWPSVIILLVTWCVGLGYLAGVLARRRAWPLAARILLCAAIASVGPAVLVGDALYGAATYQRLDENDIGDAPAYVLIGSVIVGGFIFALSLPLALVGMLIARHTGRTQKNSDGKTPPNTSLQPSAEKRSG